MAYTTWDETAPADSAQLSAGNDAIQLLKEQIRERMNSILKATPNNWEDADGTVDEIEVDLSAVGIRTDVALYYGPSQFNTISDEDFNLTDTYYESDDESNKHIYLDFQLPVGAHIKSVNAMVSRTGSNTITLGFYRRAYNTTPGLTVLGSDTLSADGVTDVQVYAGDYTIPDAESFVLKLQNGGDRIRVYGVKIVLDLPGVETYV